MATVVRSIKGQMEEEMEDSPREVVLVRDQHTSFGSISEKQVIIRFTTDGILNEMLIHSDLTLMVNEEGVTQSLQEHVNELIRSSKRMVNLLVCQPQPNNPMEDTAPILNVLEVFLVNGETKFFKYDANTTVQDILISMFENLPIKYVHHFGLAFEHMKITRKNTLTILNSKDELSKLASGPGAHCLKCMLRVAFLPRNAQDLLINDPVTFKYLYIQCCNDSDKGLFMPELKCKIAIQLTAVYMQQHCLTTRISRARKVLFKTVDYGNKMPSLLPPVKCWEGSNLLPFGRGSVIGKDGKIHYINYSSDTMTANNPMRGRVEKKTAESQREVVLIRHPNGNFGIVVSKKNPVFITCVKDIFCGPNEMLMPGDRILKVNGEDVTKWPHEYVTEFIKSCERKVNLLVCQPQYKNSPKGHQLPFLLLPFTRVAAVQLVKIATIVEGKNGKGSETIGRVSKGNGDTHKSALLTGAKKPKVKNIPSRVHFEEGISVNETPLLMPVEGLVLNELEVFLETGMTMYFKYDANTTVQDVLNWLFSELSIKYTQYYSLAFEQYEMKARRNCFTIMNPKDKIAKLVLLPDAHPLRCVLRVAFAPRYVDMLKEDAFTFDYLYTQYSNDLVQERFSPQLNLETVVRLTAYHIQQLCLGFGFVTSGNNMLNTIEWEYGGLDRYVPSSLLYTVGGQKRLTQFMKTLPLIPSARNARLYFLKILTATLSYGAKCFPVMRSVRCGVSIMPSNVKTKVLVSPRFGITQMNYIASEDMKPIPLCFLEKVCFVEIKREDEGHCLLLVHSKERQPLVFNMEENHAKEFILFLSGYYRVLNRNDELQVKIFDCSLLKKDTVPKLRHDDQISIQLPSSLPGSPDITRKFKPEEGADLVVNELEVFLETGKIMYFKYDANTTVQDVLNWLFNDLSIKYTQHYSLAFEQYVMKARRNCVTIVDPNDEIAKLVSRPDAHSLRCVLRVAFVPRDVEDLLQEDSFTFHYLYTQCSNDLVQERFSRELSLKTAVQLTALHIQQLCLNFGIVTSGQIMLGTIEWENGDLKRYIPSSILFTMKGRKLFTQFMKVCPKFPSAKLARLDFLKILSEKSSYGAKCFPAVRRIRLGLSIKLVNLKIKLLVSPTYGMQQIIKISKTDVDTALLCYLEEVCCVEMKRENQGPCLLRIHIKEKQPLIFNMEEKNAKEFILFLSGYRNLSGDELEVKIYDYSLLQKDAGPEPIFIKLPSSLPGSPNIKRKF